MKLKIITAVGLCLAACFAKAQTSIQDEISFLQNEFFQARPYPIIIVNKAQVRGHLSRLGLLAEGASERAQAEALKDFFKTQAPLSDNEAVNLIPYMTVMNSSATSLPFFERDSKGLRMTKCFVLPNGEVMSHEQELKRSLGIQPETEHLYSSQEIQSLANKLSAEDLRLFSLYHELSHCLDPKYILTFQTSAPSGQDIHRSEVFAEVNAVLLLYKHKKNRALGYKRALLRGLYTLRMGPYIAKAPAGLAGPTFNQGGAIYYLSGPLIKAQARLESFRFDVRKMSLDQIIQTSIELTENHALSSRSFSALHNSILHGEDAGLKQYEAMAIKDPDLFLGAYTDLQSAWSFLNFVPRALEK